MTMDELRSALKVIDRELATYSLEERLDFGKLYGAVSELSEYLIKNHARIERLSANVSKLMKKLEVKP